MRPDKALGGEVVKWRVGNVIVKRVADKWHVYTIGPVVAFESLEVATAYAHHVHSQKPKGEAK